MPGGNMQQMLKQAQKMQEKLAKVQEELEAREYEASAGGGMVTVKANGKKEILARGGRPRGRRDAAGHGHGGGQRGAPPGGGDFLPGDGEAHGRPEPALLTRR